jgi:hypothetical protein
MKSLRALVIAEGARPSNGRSKIGLLIVEGFVGLMAVPCGILLIFDKLGMSRDALESSPFNTFLVPGLVLTFVVGGSLLCAAYAEWRHRPIAPFASLVSGGILLGWIVVEAVMVSSGRGLQIAIFGCALLILALSGRQFQDIHSPHSGQSRLATVSKPH